MISKKRVFIVDDDPIFFLLMERIIAKSDLNAEVTGFYNGSLAMEYIEDNLADEQLLPDIIFVDLSMPVMDGWTFIDEIRAILPFVNKMPTIYLLSATVSSLETERAARYPFVKEFAVKSLMRRQLIDMIGAHEEVPVRMAS